MDSSAMDLGVYKASIQYEDRIYNNASGMLAEQTKANGNYLLHSNGVSNGDRMVYDDEENYVIKHYESNDNSPGYDVITVDPNCFYSSDDDDIVVDIECDQSETNTEQDSESSAECVDRTQYPLMTQPIVLRSAEQLPTTAPMDDMSFDITNVNITDFCAGDDQLFNADDDILFVHSNGDLGQFDLANYVDGGSSSLLLSPPPPVTIVRQRTPLKISPVNQALAALNGNVITRGEDDSPVSPEQQNSKLNEKAEPAIVAAATNGSRRKRRNLTKAFIDTTDDSDSENDATGNNQKIQQSKKQRRKDDDPIWNPVAVGSSKINGKAKNDAIPTKSEEISKEKQRNEKLKQAPMSLPSATGQSNGLRSMLKKQMLSNRPMKRKPMKTAASPMKVTTPNANTTNVTKRSFGVGRGKDISITAKYFNASAKSSDTSDRDNTDNDNLALDVESGSGVESDASMCNSVRSEKRVKEEEKPECKVGKEGVAGATKINVADDKIGAENQQKSEEVKPTTKGPVLMDNVDFAKAIFVDAKETAKVKPMKREDFKKSASEQSIKRPPTLFNVSNKFKTNCLPVVATSRPFTELRPPNGHPKLLKTKSLTDVCPKPAIKLPKIPLRRRITAEPKVEQNCAEEAKIGMDVAPAEDVKSDATATASKKKLNIQEYLKRKSINPLACEKAKVCRDEHSYGKPVETSAKPTADENCPVQSSETSLYEEIISVSMGCATDVSIPELRVDATTASKSTVLLSSIQTTIEKANAAIEHGKISSSSLLSSIQDVILKKTTIRMEMDVSVDEKNPGTKKEDYEHGENKVIMHLRKDRVRPTTVTIAIQTDPYFQFPPLERLALANRKNDHFDRCKSLGRSSVSDTMANNDRSMRAYSMQNERFVNRNYRSRKDHSESSYYSNDDDQQQMSSPQRRSRHSEYLESIAHPSAITNSQSQVRRRHKRSGSFKKSRRYRSKYERERDSNRHRTISRSLSQSSDTSSSSHTSTSSSGSSATSVSSNSSKSLNSYGDSSTKSYYGDEHCDRRYNRPAQNWPRGARNQQMPNHRSDSPEHRRIVYVGRIASETTKDDLRRIFSVYGRVENVTIHYKEMKWKYGFVTFERPADAYKVIDTSAKNPALKDYDISFGGRRSFCREKYLDLDNTEDDYSQTMHPMVKQPQRDDDSFEALLRKLKEKLKDTKE